MTSMTEETRLVCPHCGFEYSSVKQPYCPNCNAGKAKKNILIPLSEKALGLPIGGRIAVFLTSVYAVYESLSQLTGIVFAGLGLAALYGLGLYLWIQQTDKVERPVWFLAMILMLYVPVVGLLSVILFL